MLSLALPAFLAGVLMFLAPCTLPIVPGYLAFISASDGSARARKVLPNALAFVIGFSVVFILLGLFAGFVGSLLGEWRYALSRVAGAVLVIFGATMLGAAVPGVSSEFHLPLPSWLAIGRPQSSLVIGALFALGWSPCIGPILGSILFLASSSATALAGAVLLGVFSLGLALPFLVVALAIDRASGALGRLAALSRSLQIAGGIILIALGLLMLFNWSGLLMSWGDSLFGFLHYDALQNYL